MPCHAIQCHTLVTRNAYTYFDLFSSFVLNDRSHLTGCFFSFFLSSVLSVHSFPIRFALHDDLFGKYCGIIRTIYIRNAYRCSWSGISYDSINSACMLVYACAHMFSTVACSVVGTQTETRVAVTVHSVSFTHLTQHSSEYHLLLFYWFSFDSSENFVFILFRNSFEIRKQSEKHELKLRKWSV